MKISILGSGNIGGTLGRKWAGKGHTIKFGVRDVADHKHQSLMDSAAGDITVASLSEAIEFGEVVVLAIPGSAVAPLVQTSDHALAGKIIIDATNRIGQAEMNNLSLIAERVPSARLYRAFNSLGWENFDNPQLGGSQVDLFYCGDPGDARPVVERLIADIGLRPIYVGDLTQLDVVDNLAKLWFALAFGQGFGRRLAFKLLTE
jgi:predicted dinucleotide-binding enzyme